jgi:hypothetical protein
MDTGSIDPTLQSTAAEASSPASHVQLLQRAANRGTVEIEWQGTCTQVTVEDAGTQGFHVSGTGIDLTIPRQASLGGDDSAMVQALEQGMMPQTTSTTSRSSMRTGGHGPAVHNQTQQHASTSFDPTGFAARFDQVTERSGVQREGQKHYLSSADAAAVVRTFGAADAKALQRGLNAAGANPPLTVDGKIGGRTLQALTEGLAGEGEFNFPPVQSAADAEAFARVAELLIENANVGLGTDQVQRVQGKLASALDRAVSTAPAEVQTAIRDRATAMTSTGGGGGIADAQAILQTAARPMTDRIGQMTADQLAQAMTQPGALDGESGTAIRARLQDPQILAAVAGNTAALGNATVAAEVTQAIGGLDAPKLLALATAVGPNAAAPVKTAIESRIDAVAATVTGVPHADKLTQLTQLRDTQLAINPQATMRPSVQNATIALVRNASLEQLDGRDHTEAQRGFMGDLQALYNNTLPPEVNTAITERRATLAQEGRQQVVQQRMELAQSPEVNNVYQRIIGAVVDGVSGSEDNTINDLLRELGGADKEGNMTEGGARKVGALVERMITENRWTGMIDDYGRSERKDLLRFLSHLPAGTVSPRTMAEISRQAADRLGNDDGDVQRLRTTFNQALRAAQPDDRQKMLTAVKGEHDFARAVVLDRSNFAALREAYPSGQVASRLHEVFRDDEQRVAFMRNLVSTVADPGESDANRAWAQTALQDARVAFRDPLEDGDLADVQSHITSVRESADVPAASRQFLTEFWQTLEDEKRIN